MDFDTHGEPGDCRCAGRYPAGFRRRGGNFRQEYVTANASSKPMTRDSARFVIFSLRSKGICSARPRPMGAAWARRRGY
ncbi:hypothetical protein PCLA_04r0106 [Pseudomonas citronellolis]|nr:hypothetical protein PCLA_04r0106 [Pseudomonas citronellolis]